ncbi:MAG: hypothetical protein COA45_12365 [Zetaproteobacteria bacterium]|nr:MAG: hypothetical protein COA45_12365 [Zetaproteobacteria bacterium]
MKRLALITTILSLTGCATTPPAQYVDVNTTTQAHEGILLTHFSCGETISQASIYEIGKGPDVKNGTKYRAAPLSCRNEFNTLILPEGNYYIGSYLGKGLLNLSDQNAFKFSISANKINYIGHMQTLSAGARRKIDENGAFSPRITTTTYLISPSVIDKETIAKEYLNNERPDLLKKYSFSKNIAYK